MGFQVIHELLITYKHTHTHTRNKGSHCHLGCSHKMYSFFGLQTRFCVVGFNGFLMSLDFSSLFSQLKKQKKKCFLCTIHIHAVCEMHTTNKPIQNWGPTLTALRALSWLNARRGKFKEGQNGVLGIELGLCILTPAINPFYR